MPTHYSCTTAGTTLEVSVQVDNTPPRTILAAPFTTTPTGHLVPSPDGRWCVIAVTFAEHPGMGPIDRSLLFLVERDQPLDANQLNLATGTLDHQTAWCADGHRFHFLGPEHSFTSDRPTARFVYDAAARAWSDRLDASVTDIPSTPITPLLAIAQRAEISEARLAVAGDPEATRIVDERDAAARYWKLATSDAPADAFLDVIRLAPAWSDPYEERCKRLRAAGDTARWSTAADEWCAATDTSMAWLHRAAVQMMLGNHESAITMLKTAVERDSSIAYEIEDDAVFAPVKHHFTDC